MSETRDWRAWWRDAEAEMLRLPQDKRGDFMRKKLEERRAAMSPEERERDDRMIAEMNDPRNKGREGLIFAKHSLEQNPQPVMTVSCLGNCLLFVVTPAVFFGSVYAGVRWYWAAIAAGAYFFVVGHMVRVMRRRVGLPT